MRRAPMILSTLLALATLAAPHAAAQATTTRERPGDATPAKPPIPARPERLEFPPLDFTVPDGERYRHVLSNGIPVYVAEDHALPLVDVTITLRAGSFLDPDDRPGAGLLTGTMLRRGGTKSLPPDAFDERVAFLAANMSSFTGDMSAGASLDSLSTVLDESLELFFDMLKNPRFAAERIEVERDSMLEGMKQRNDNPASISSREWQWLIYGRDHFTSRALTRAELDAITREDLIAFHKSYWRPENMIIGVSGDVDTESILKQLEAHLEDWESEGPAVAWPPASPEHQPQPGVYYVQKEIPQGRVLIGHLGMRRSGWDDPDAFAVMVMNDILGGGGFTSRLTKRIRSDEGLAYSAGSGFGIGQYWPGVFRIGFQSKSETVPYAARIAVDEIRAMQREEVTDEELRVAKNSFIDVFPRRFESAAQIVGTFIDDEYDGRPHSYWKTYRDRIRAVDADDVLRVAKGYLHPDRLVFLIVGSWDEIAPGDPEGRASMQQIHEGKATRLPLRDPLTLEPME